MPPQRRAARAAVSVPAGEWHNWTMRSIADSMFQPIARADPSGRLATESELTWRIMGTLGFFRMLAAGALVLVFFTSNNPKIFGDAHPDLFLTTVSVYVVLASVLLASARLRWMPISMQVTVQMIVDISLIVLLMHCSGGISSGLGGLLLIFVGAGTLALPATASFFFAAVATLAVLFEQILSQLEGLSTAASYPAAGVLGTILFAIPLAARPVAKRMRENEALALQRGLDLENLAALNQYVVQHLRESILVLDENDRIRLINESASRILSDQHSVAGTQLASVSQILADYIHEWRGGVTVGQLPAIVLPGRDSEIKLNVHIAPFGRGEPGEQAILVFLEDASLLAERVQQSKLASLGRLSASIAHEIRNPVGALSHASQLLAETDNVSDEEQRLIEIIVKHSDRVSHIVDNVLQLSRRESGRPEQLDMNVWLRQFALEFCETMQIKPESLMVTELSDSISVRIDRGHLHQIMWNLCENALKHGNREQWPAMQISVGRAAGNERPYIDVRDFGSGIDESAQDKIFEPFFTAQQQGSGLGLYIARELCELNLATLTFRRPPGNGCIFRIVFADPRRWEPAA